MIRNVRLDLYHIARVEDMSAVVIPDNLTLKFVTDSYPIAERTFIVLKNGQKEAKIKVDDGEVVIPDELLFSGYLTARIVVYNEEGKELNEWNMYPLRIIEADGTVQVYDALSDIEKRLKNIEEKLPTNIFKKGE